MGAQSSNYTLRTSPSKINKTPHVPLSSGTDMSRKLNFERLGSSVTIDGEEKTASFSDRKKPGIDQSMLKNLKESNFMFYYMN